MRPLEWMLVLLSAVQIGWSLLRPRESPTWIRIISICAAMLIPLHAFLEGAHWQMIPVYLAALVLLWPSVYSAQVRATRYLAVAATALLVAGLAICYTLPMFHLSRPTGHYPVGTRTLWFVDPHRLESHDHVKPGNREIVVQLWYPSATATGKHAAYRRLKETDLRSTYQAVLKTDSLQDAAVASGRYPVILFNHAWRGFRNRSTFLMQELASQGFIVAGVSHPYNAALVELHDGTLADGRDQVDLGAFYSKPALTLEQRQSLARTEMRIQTDDDKFLLDQLELLNHDSTSAFFDHCDLNHVGAFGHSFGGSVSAELASEDPRVVSAIILDGVLQGPVAQTGLNKPLFRIKAESLEMPAGSENSPIQSTRVHAQMALLGEGALASSFQRFGGYNVEIRGIDHENFSDKGFFSPFHSLSGIGSLPQSRAAAIISSYVVAFFLQTLRGVPQPILSSRTSPFPEVRELKVWPSASPGNEAPPAAR